MSDKKPPPVARFKIGYVTASVWENTNSRNSVFYTVELTRSYKDGDTYKQTGSLMHDDLLNAATVLKRAEEFIADRQYGE